MSQWGSYELARQGLSYLQILYRYYGDDIEIVTNTPVQAIIPTYPQRPLQLGNISNETRSIQVRLNRISTNYPNIPKINPVNGIFSIDTENAVITFQNTFNLVVDGIVGKATWYKIQYVYYAVKRVCELASEGVLYDDVSKQYPDYLLAGNRGPEVAQVQYFLNFVSQYENNVSPVLVDGIFGPATEKSVRDFQRLYNLNVDGIVGPDTFNTLYDVYIGIVRSLPDNIFINQARPFQGRNLLLGSEGEDVGYLQDYINYISGVYPEIPPVVRDSIFDENTLAAVLALEEHLGLPADGIIDAAAWNEIASLYDDLHTDTHVNLGQYPGYEISQQLSGG